MIASPGVGRTRGLFNLVDQLHRECNLTTVLVTHNMTLAQRCDRVLRLENGRLQAVSCSETMR